MECVCFTLIVDDIVLPHGETAMEVLGGGGPQTLFGYQLVTNQSAAVGLSAGVGPDLPRRCKDWLESLGVDTSGLVPYDRPTPRAWQVFEEWGRRTQIWRGREDPCDELYDMLRPKYDTMPPHFRRSSNYHLGIHPLHPPTTLMRQLRQAAHDNGGVLSIEPYTSAETPARPDQVTSLLSLCDIFSPNQAEAESIVGPGSPEELARRLLALSPPGGADVVVVRCGAEGVLVARRAPVEPRTQQQAAASVGAEAEAAAGPCMVEVEAYRVPAVEDTAVVDVTGCGNAFCGGFLAAMYRGRSRGGTVSAVSGTVSAEVSEPSTSEAGPSAPAEGRGAGGAGQRQRPPQRPPAWVRAGDLWMAGAWGCVAASFMAEERGVPMKRVADLQDRAGARLEALLPRVQAVHLAQAGVSREAACNVVAAMCCGKARRPGCRPTVRVRVEEYFASRLGLATRPRGLRV
ncbi:hypothetical protein PLESTF_001483900 [Pleodorina starrii]|nr:hypothetical protein PLESTM_000489100 [Pleodorina starrii]GLC74276.1 hypothetical protein PLESTF_001483900 [Pleodorina starrii]